jgi:hypothetical protein
VFFEVGEGVGGVGFEVCVEVGELGREVVDVSSELGVGDVLGGVGHGFFLFGWGLALKKYGWEVWFWCFSGVCGGGGDVGRWMWCFLAIFWDARWCQEAILFVQEVPGGGFCGAKGCQIPLSLRDFLFM